MNGDGIADKTDDQGGQHGQDHQDGGFCASAAALSGISGGLLFLGRRGLGLFWFLRSRLFKFSHGILLK